MRTGARLLLSFLMVAVFAMPSAADLGDYFISTDWLAENRPDTVVVDVRVLPLYLLGHIDGSFHLDKEKFLSARNGVKSLVPTAAEFQSLMNAYGITPETVVVAYAEHDNPYAARFIWTMKYHGHPQAFVLDGGYEKWAQERRPTAMLPTFPARGNGYISRSGIDIGADAAYVLSRLHSRAALIWDTRKHTEFEGTDVRADRGGHIPGAQHLDWVNLQKEVNGVKVLKSAEEIRALLLANGITPDREIIAHCQSGIRSSYATLALLGLGYQVRNYDGSWTEWANNRTYPVAKPMGLVSN